MKEIAPRTISRSSVMVPGSKSITHRMLIASALSDGKSTVENPLAAEDTELTADALRRLGARIDWTKERAVVQGTCHPTPHSKPIFLGNSGTSMRLLMGTAALGDGTYVLTGTPRMQQRPVNDLLVALQRIGVPARSQNGNGCPPVEIVGGQAAGGPVDIDCTVSSQFLSSLLLMAPLTRRGLDITVTGGPVSRPYIDLTVEVMEAFEVQLEREGYERFRVPGGQRYRPGDYAVEPDASQAGYFWAAAAVTGGRIRVNGLRTGSRQGDVGFTQVLASMGCLVENDPEGIAVTGGRLKGVDVDMGDMPDLVPTLAVVAAFADGRTNIRNVAHLKEKESDRLTAVASQLEKMGIPVKKTSDGLTIEGGAPRGAEIETFNDHRMAMSFAVAGLRVPGVKIMDEACVAKSFPNFWEVFETL